MALVDDRLPQATSPNPGLPPWRWYVPFIVGLGLYLVLGIFVAAFAGAAGWTGDLPDRFVLFATLLQDAALIGLTMWVAQVSGPHARWHLGVRRTRPWRSLGLAVAAFLIFLAFLIVWQQLLGTDETDDLAQELGAEDSAFNLVAVTVLVCLAAPVAEELFFRGFLFGGLRKLPHFDWIGAAIMSGAVFGVVHAGGTDAVFLVPLAVLGIMLCWLYQKTGSLLPGMGVHAFNNAFALGATLGWEPWQVLLAVVLAPIVVVALMSRVAVASARPEPSEPPEPSGPPFMPPVAPQLPAR